MGFEAFRVELRGGVKYGEAEEVVRKLPGVKPDQDALSTKGSAFFVLDDGRHVIELELADSPLRLSCRFTLSHPPSVDSAFLGLLRELMLRLAMEARICDDVRPEHSRSFSLAEFEDFSSLVLHYVSARRAEWTAAFGDTAMAASTNEVYQQVILPRCQPRVEQPT